MVPEKKDLAKSNEGGGAPRSRAGGACEAPPHRDGNRIARSAP